MLRGATATDGGDPTVSAGQGVWRLFWFRGWGWRLRFRIQRFSGKRGLDVQGSRARSFEGLAWGTGGAEG